MKIKTLIACLGAFITLISGVGFNTLNNQKEVNQNEKRKNSMSLQKYHLWHDRRCHKKWG